MVDLCEATLLYLSNFSLSRGDRPIDEEATGHRSALHKGFVTGSLVILICYLGKYDLDVIAIEWT